MKKTLAFLLVLLTVFSLCIPLASAETGTETIDPIAIPTVTDMQKDTVNIYAVSYTQEDMLPSGMSGAAIPVICDAAGWLYVTYNGTELGQNSGIYLFKDASLSTPMGTGNSIAPEYASGTHSFRIDEPGTYYLAFQSGYTTSAFSNTITFAPYLIQNKNRVMSEDTWSLSANKEEGPYFKFTVKKLCKVSIYSNSQDVDIQLCDSKKNPKQNLSTELCEDNNYRTSYALSAGTYYILAKGADYGDAYELKFKTAAFTKLAENKLTKFYQATPDLNMYFRIVANDTGYIRISGKKLNGYVTLCDADRKPLSSKDRINSASEYIYENSVVYGVTKGKTYYIRVNSNQPMAYIKWANGAISDKSGSSKAKAKAMSSKTTYKGYIAAGSKTQDWYKFTLSSPKYWRLQMKGATNDTLRIRLYTASGTLFHTDYFRSSHEYGSGYFIYTTSKLPKGTYYVCISRDNSKSSGYYSLYWKAANVSLQPG
ncbi:MAG: hypothetical protein IJP03_05175 [Christensenellaceae bacterium]|nr:hypothetical protein [Christensenellaceae bacterium]